MSKGPSGGDHAGIVKLIKTSLAGVGCLYLLTGSFLVTTLGTATALSVLYLSGIRRWPS